MPTPVPPVAAPMVRVPVVDMPPTTVPPAPPRAPIAPAAVVPVGRPARAATPQMPPEPMDDAPWPEDDGPPWEESDPGPSRVVAVPVRDAGEPSPLDQPRPREEPGTQTVLPAAPGGSVEGDFWFETVMQLVRAETITALVRELGLQSQLIARDTGQWMLRVERSSLNQSNIRERLAAALQTLGHEVRLTVEIGSVSDSPARRVAAEAERRQREAEAHILNDPFVQTMMRDFGGRIVPGTLKAITA